MKNLDPAIQEAFATSPSNDPVLDTIEIRHPLFPDSIRLVKNTVDLDLGLEDSTTKTFRAVGFQLTLPKNDEGGVSMMNISIADVGSEISDALKLIKGSPVKVEVWYRAYLSSDLTVPQNNPPLRLTLSGIRKTRYEVSASANFADLVNKNHLSALYTSKLFPSLAG